MDELECPACGSDDLRGAPGEGDTIHVTCQACGVVWDRDLRPRCPRCDSADVEAAVSAVVEKSRGSQLSIVGTQVVHLCRSCDADVLARYRIGRSPLMPDDLPTT